MCKGLEFGEVLMCTSSKETSSVEQRQGRAEGEKTKRWLEPDPRVVKVLVRNLDFTPSAALEGLNR